MIKDKRTQRDLHGLTADGMVLCNPRDREAAHRAAMEGIATEDAAAVTCLKCKRLLFREAKARREAETRLEYCTEEPMATTALPPRFILSDYVDAALRQATYDKLADSTFVGRVEGLPGVVAAAPQLAECQTELKSVLEDWLLLGLKLKHPLPVLAGIDLNGEPEVASLETV